MGKNKFTYKIIGLIFTLFISVSSLSGAEYQGDQPSSSFFGFLHNLFFGGSSTPTIQGVSGHPSGATYQYYTLTQGNSKSGATVVDNNGTATDQSDAWDEDLSLGIATLSATSSTKTSAKATTAQVGVGSSNSIVSTASSSTTNSGTSSSSSGGSGSSSSGGGGTTMFSLSLGRPLTSGGPYTPASGPGSYDSNGWLPDPAEPLPVGDGTWTLLVLALVYAFVRRKKLTLT
jgi:hypothetical protein